MDEESAIAAEDGGIDVAGIEAFDAWLTSDPAHLAQALPEERGVLAIMARRKERDHGNRHGSGVRPRGASAGLERAVK